MLFGEGVGRCGSCGGREDRALPALLGVNGFIHGSALAAGVADLDAVAVRVVLRLVGEVNAADRGRGTV